MPEAALRRFNDIAVGDTASFDVVLTESLVNQFAQWSGDHNPLHMDAAFAAGTPFKERVVHGFLGASFFSRLIGMHLPGTHALFLSQKISFRAPMRIGMRISVSGIVTGSTEATHTIAIRTTVADAETKKTLIDGEALVQVLT